MGHFHRNICIYVAILIIMGAIGISRGRSSHHRGRGGGGHRHSPKPPVRTIVVDQSGHGDFLTIQSAINSVPSNNRNWICIDIKAGTYKEQVMIPGDKPMIYLKGEGQRSTNVVWDSVDITHPTFVAFADNIVAKDISFTNSHNYPVDRNKNSIVTATAAMINGDKNAFFGCGFYGVQDTLWDEKGRHYFKGCTITGVTDFIMGDGQSIYEQCTISVISKVLGGTPGYITAHSRDNPNDSSGFVFKHCSVGGDGPTYLGRPWRQYARVLFHDTYLSNIVVSEGWDSWFSHGHEDQLTLAEINCTGPGSNVSKRVGWETKLSQEMVRFLTSMSFIDKEGWMRQQPYNIYS